MKLVDTKTLPSEMIDRAWALLEDSFPLNEQRSLEQHIRAMDDSAFHADAIVDGELFVGILFYWVYNDSYLFVEHLAIDPTLRSGGYGKRIMEILLTKGYITILEIDPPEDEISVRRQKFYERLGFVMNPYLHIHPSYRPTTSPHRLIVMSHPRAISEQEFNEFREYSLGHVLSYVDQ